MTKRGRRGHRRSNNEKPKPTRRKVVLTIEVEVPADWTGAMAAAEAVEILDLSEEKALVPISGRVW